MVFQPIHLVNAHFMAIGAAIAGFANTKKNWFAVFPDMCAGVLSHDRFNAIVNAIKPEESDPMLLAWLTELHTITAAPVIAADGNTLRRSHESQLQFGERRSDHSHDQCVGYGQSFHGWTNALRHDEQRDHRVPNFSKSSGFPEV